MHIAVLEDDPKQAELVALWLSSSGHTCDLFEMGREFLAAAGSGKYQLFVLDWELPDINGDEVLKQVREKWGYDIPVLFMTARDREEDIVKILQLGADDYMVKPISPMEMLARVQALGRRSNLQSGKQSSIIINNLVLDLEKRTATIDDEERALTPKEFDLIVYLTQHLGTLVTRDELLEHVWKKKGVGIDTRTVDTHVSRLRKKLQLETVDGWKLSVVYQYGYRLDGLPAPEVRGGQA